MPADFTRPDSTPAPDDPSLRTTVAPDPADSPAIVIGRYKLLHRIGEGRMGEVWLSEQTEPVRRRVALKLLKAELMGREAILRFESERQALALMDHPAIAKVLDGGSTPSGAPFLVMEYVAGTPITEYCDRHTLGVRERLDLFIQVCEGVQHAHQKAISRQSEESSGRNIRRRSTSRTTWAPRYGPAEGTPKPSVFSERWRRSARESSAPSTRRPWRASTD